MRKLSLIVLILVFCIYFDAEAQLKNDKVQYQLNPALQLIIDSANVVGSVLVYDALQQIYYSNDFSWAKKGRLPASTFKIVNSIIGLETGVIANDSSIFKWDGSKRKLNVWEKDLNLTEAFHLSCVPCYQEVARNIGCKRMKEYLKKLNYGNMVVDSASIALFWLEGSSKISQFQQLNFLRRFYFSKLPINKRTETIMKKLMVIEKNDSYTLSGKTGWAIRNGHNNGWFVGYVETNNKVCFIAVNIDPKQNFNMDMFPMIRKEITLKALKMLGIIK